MAHKIFYRSTVGCRVIQQKRMQVRTWAPQGADQAYDFLPIANSTYTVDYDPFIKSQLASRNQLSTECMRVCESMSECVIVRVCESVSLAGWRRR
jgi:hypothetical protein